MSATDVHSSKPIGSSLNAVRGTLKSVALPVEHGGWMFLCEPVLLALAVAPTLSGALLGLAALGAFLSRHPLKLAIDDRQKGRHFPRTTWAERFTLFYACVAALGLAGAIITAQHAFGLPLLLAIPLVLVQLWFDASHLSRALAAEVCGALALGSVAAAMALSAGWPVATAFTLWAVLALRFTTAILYVRARLRLEHGKKTSAAPVWITHALALACVLLLAALHLTPWLVCVAFVVLGARAFWGLSHLRRPLRAKQVGIQEVVMGLVTIVLVAAGYWFGV